MLNRPFPIGPVEFDVPHAATADGELELACQPKLGIGGFERGCRIAEVWLIRNEPQHRQIDDDPTVSAGP